RRALALTHTGFGGLLGDRLVREQPDPDFSAPLYRPGHRDPRRFNLPVPKPGALERPEALLAEADRASAPGLSGHAAPLLLSVLDLLWHHHGGVPSIPYWPSPGVSGGFTSAAGSAAGVS